jgi:HD-GYP domain-containing protein (c-di-GMP phosphodiesterase class II)
MAQESAATPSDAALLESQRVRVRLASLYVWVLGVAAVCLLGVLAYLHLFVPGYRPAGSFPWASLAFLLALAVFAEACTIRFGSGMEMSGSFLACFLGGAIAGPLAGFGIAVGSQLYHFRLHHWQRNVFFVAMAGLLGGGTSLLYWGSLAHLGGFEVASTEVVVLVGLAAGVFYPLENFALVMPVGRLRRGVGFGQLWREAVKPFLPFQFFFIAISLGLISIYHHYLPRTGGASSFYSTLVVGLFLLPVVGLIWVFRAYARQRDLAMRNERLAVRNERLALQAVASQITALDLKDDYTAQHSAAVAQWATDIAKAMGLPEQQQNLTHLAGLVHDVGKIGIPDELLKTQMRLGAEDWAMIESHCFHGHKILGRIDQFGQLADVVLHHHERYDGNGYPHGLAGRDIPLESRIIAVADAYSAMISERPYGPPLPTLIAEAELEFRKGAQFDPEVVDYFLDLLHKSDERYRLGMKADFRMEVQDVKFLRELPVEPEDGQVGQAQPVVRARQPEQVEEGAASARAAREEAQERARTGRLGNHQRSGNGGKAKKGKAVGSQAGSKNARTRT